MHACDEARESFVQLVPTSSPPAHADVIELVCARGLVVRAIIRRLYEWIAHERPRVVDESPIAKAMN